MLQRLLELQGPAKAGAAGVAILLFSLSWPEGATAAALGVWAGF